MAKRKPAEAAQSEAAKPSRRLRLGRYKSFRLQRQKLAPAYEDRGLPSGFKIFKRSLRLLLTNWKLFGALLLLYGVINLALAGGFVSTDTLTSAKTSIESAVGGPLGSIATGVTLVTVLASSGGGDTFSQATGAFQVMLFFLTTLALIFCLRQVSAGKTTKLKSAIYVAPTPLIPFLLVILVLALELLPFVAGGAIYSMLVSNNIATTWLEQIPIFLFLFLTTLLSVYWLCGSIFAIYIVTLPGMTPIRALKSSNELVRFRRVAVLRKILALLLLLGLIGVFFVGPIALTFPSAASPTFFGLLVLTLGVSHSYLYTLYRELIG